MLDPARLFLPFFLFFLTLPPMDYLLLCSMCGRCHPGGGAWRKGGCVCGQAPEPTKCVFVSAVVDVRSAPGGWEHFFVCLSLGGYQTIPALQNKNE